MKPEDIEIVIPPLNEQKEFVQKMRALEAMQAIAKLADTDPETIPPCFRRYDEGYKPPTPDELAQAFDGYSANRVAAVIGRIDGRTVRKWKSGEREIGYHSWRLFLIRTGKVIP